jgi:hypothetical protein
MMTEVLKAATHVRMSVVRVASMVKEYPPFTGSQVKRIRLEGSGDVD